MPGIEFVDPVPDPGPDEELDTGRRRQASPRTTRFVRTAAGTILALLAGLVLVGYLHHDDGGGTKGGGGPTPPSVGTVSLAVVPEADPATPATLAIRATPTTPGPTAIDTSCPVVDACAVSAALPPAVADALRARLPGITDVIGTSVLVVGPEPTLRTRRVSARDGNLAVAVEIHPATRYDHPRSAGLDASGGERLVYARVLTRALAVTVSVTGPSRRVPGPATVRSLAADPRLLVAG